MANYFVVRSGEDGTTIKGPYSSDALQKMLDEGYWGDGVTFLSALPESDKGCWYADESALLIIKGEIVTPKAQQTIVKHRLP